MTGELIGFLYWTTGKFNVTNLHYGCYSLLCATVDPPTSDCHVANKCAIDRSYFVTRYLLFNCQQSIRRKIVAMQDTVDKSF